MKWIVTLANADGKTCTVETFATNKSDAECRAAMKAETDYGFRVARTVVCRRTASSTR